MVAWADVTAGGADMSESTQAFVFVFEATLTDPETGIEYPRVRVMIAVHARDRVRAAEIAERSAKSGLTHVRLIN